MRPGNVGVAGEVPSAALARATRSSHTDESRAVEAPRDGKLVFRSAGFRDFPYKIPQANLPTMIGGNWYFDFSFIAPGRGRVGEFDD